MRVVLPLVLLTVLPSAQAHYYNYTFGAVAAGHDLLQQTMPSVEAAQAWCSANSSCQAFTYDSGARTFSAPTKVYFKAARYTNLDSSWSSYIKDEPPPPPFVPKLFNPCLNKSSASASQKWCDPTQPIDDRVADMVKRMTVKEKIGALRDESAPIGSLHLPYYDWWNEATHGVASGEHGTHNTLDEPYQSNFPFPITTGMAFNRTLWKATGRQIGREARAFMNSGNAYSTFWAPVINLAREPRWGRNIECPGEDPYLSGEYSVAFVHGMERAPEDPGHIQASACCKHYAANSMEHTTEGGQTHTRHNFDANISMQDLVDSYLAPFQACIEKGQVSGLMCSYNSINGVPACANHWLLQDVARDAWGFDGYVTSDCGAEMDVLANHHYEPTGEEAVRDILHAGTDSDCGGFLGKYGPSALEKGLITEADLDARLKMLFRVRMRLGHFDPPGPLQQIPPSAICDELGVATARDATAQSVALLFNPNAVLPYDASKIKNAAVIGPNAKQGYAITSYYGPSSSCDGKYWTMVDALETYIKMNGSVAYAAGVSSTLAPPNTTEIEEAAALAKDKDAVVLVLGTDLTSAHEEFDAHNITIPEGQWALTRAVATAATVPVVVVIMTAVPLDLSELLALPNIGAVLHAGQPSVQTLGIGDVLFGTKVPAGRLIQTIYEKSYADQVSIFDFNMRPGPSAFPRPDCNATGTQPASQPCPLGTNPGRTYRFFTGKPVLPFGFGLSYTTFAYAHADTTEPEPAPSMVSLAGLPALLRGQRHGFIAADEVGAAGPAGMYAVNVTNTGTLDADDVVLGFLTPPSAGQNGAPLKSLFAFERVHVPAGETATVQLYPELTDFALVDGSGAKALTAGDWTLEFGVQEGGGYARRTLRAHL